MKILVVLSRLPYPLDKGDKLRAYHQLKHLKQRHQIILCCTSEESPSEKQLAEVRKVCHDLHVFQLKRWRILLSLLVACFSRKPFQVHYFYQKKVHQALKALISAEQPDHIYAQLLRTAEYVKEEYNFAKTLDYQDAFSKGMDRRARLASWPLSEIFAAERKRLIAYENIIFEYFENKSIISEEDRRHIYHPRRNDIAIISNGIDTSFFAREQQNKENRQAKSGYDLLFTGNMSYAPNVEAAVYIVEEVLPLLRKEYEQVTLLIAGSSPSRKVKELAAVKGVEVSGWMDDIRDAYRCARIFFAPMQIGTGLQNKLLEAMAMRLPCITSSLANRALKAEHGRQLLVSDTAQEQAQNILQLLKHPEQRETLGEAGRNYVQQHYSWEASVKQLEKLFSANSITA